MSRHRLQTVSPLDLPNEILERILRYALSCSTPQIIKPHPSTRLSTSEPPKYSVLCTCRLIQRLGAGGLYLNLNEWVLDLQDRRVALAYTGPDVESRPEPSCVPLARREVQHMTLMAHEFENWKGRAGAAWIPGVTDPDV